MATSIHLTSELERFARECVAEGRYDNVSEVVQAGLRLLQDAEQKRRQLLAVVREAEAEIERDGTFPLESVLAEVDAIIDAEEK